MQARLASWWETLSGMDEGQRRRAATAALAAAVGLSTLAILYWSRGESFFADDWSYIIYRREWDLDILFAPQIGHLMVLPLIVFKGLLEIFGADSALPFRLAALFFVQLNGVLIFLLARRRVGPGLALVPAVLLLFLGSSWEMIIAPFALNALMSIAAGLGALLCLDRRDLRGDVWACVLLVVSLASFSTGLVFAVIAAVEVLLRVPAERWRRAWVFAVPIVLYGIWALWATKYDQSTLQASNIGGLPSAMAQGVAGAAASLFGVFRTPGPDNPAAPDLGINIDWGIPLAIALIAVVVARLRFGQRPTPRAWALIAAMVVFWGLLALSISPARSPLASRYIYPGVLLVLLLAVELAARVRISTGWRFAIAAAVAISLLANVDTIRVGGRFYRDEARYNLSQLGALELDRDQLVGQVQIEGETGALLPHPDMTFLASQWFAAADEVGSPAYSPSKIADQPPEVRAAVDQLLGRALDLHPEPIERLQPTAGAPVEPTGPGSQASVERQGNCILVRPDLGREGRAALRIPPGGFGYQANPDAPVRVSLGRFGDRFAWSPEPVLGPAVVEIPDDGYPLPWRALIRSTSPVTACPA